MPALDQWIKDANRDNQSQQEILSFDDYCGYFNKNAKLECRPSYQYLLDMIEHFGRNEKKHFKVFSLEDPECTPVYGQYKTQEALYQNLKNFQKEGFNNKFILFVGPNGSAKTTMIQKFMKGAELYSESKEGALYSFSWVFPIENYVKGTLGLKSAGGEHNLKTYAYLDDKDISAILGSELKDHPLLLIPLKYRQKIIDESLKKNPEQLATVQKSYLYRGDLSKRNRMIYDGLLKNYKGDHEEVLKHIRVERFHISKRYSTGAVTIEPQLHVDAQMQQITMDRRLASLPPGLQSLNLYSLQGEVVLANRGILEFSDLLKRPLDAFKYLLMTMETGNVNLSGILVALDIFFIGTSNEIHLHHFKEHPDFNSFKGRFNFIKVPYLLNYQDEENIYGEQVNALKEQAVFEPHALEALCLFAVMTRLRAPQLSNYHDKRLGQIASELNPLEKAFLYADDVVYPDRLDMEAKTILRQNLDKLVGEYENGPLYEGKFGISPRDLKKIIYKLATKHHNITAVEVIDYLEHYITKRSDLDYLMMTPQGDYHQAAHFLTLLNQHTLATFDREMREGLGLVDDRSYEDFLKKYIQNITALIKKEKIKNNITGKYENADEFFIKEFESNISLQEDAESFRSQLLSHLGAFALDHPGKEIVYTEVFSDLAERLQESFRNEQRKQMLNIAKNLVFFEAEVSDEAHSIKTPLSEENRKLIAQTVDNLCGRYGYTKYGALSMMRYLLKERY